MNNTTKIIIAAVAVVIIAGGAALFAGNKSGNESTNDGTTNAPGTSDNSGESQSPNDEVVATTVTYTSSGFRPASVTVPSGSAVRIVNESDDAIAPSSNNHPEHTLNPEINFPDIEPGQSATMVVTEKGTWGMHNHFKDDHRMTIVVE